MLLLRSVLCALSVLCGGNSAFPAQYTINTGSAGNDGAGETWRSAMGKINTNFNNLFGGNGANAISTSNGLGTNTVLRNVTTYDRTNYFSSGVREPFWGIGNGGRVTLFSTNGVGQLIQLRERESAPTGYNRVEYLGGLGANDLDAFSMQVYGGLAVGQGNPRITAVLGDDAYTYRFRELNLEDSVGNSLLQHDNLGNIWLAGMGTRIIKIVAPGSIGTSAVTLSIDNAVYGLNTYTFTAGTQFSTNGSASVVATNLAVAISNAFTLIDWNYQVLSIAQGTNVILTPLTGTRQLSITVPAGMSYKAGPDGQVTTLGTLNALGGSTTNLAAYIGTNFFVVGGSGDTDGSGTVNVLDATFIGQWLANGTNLDNVSALTPPAYGRANITGDGVVNLLDRRLVSQIVNASITPSNAHWLGKWIKGKAISYDLFSRVGVLGPGAIGRDNLAWFEIACDPSTNYALMVNTNWLTVTNAQVGIGTAVPAYTLDVAGTIRPSNATVSRAAVFDANGALTNSVTTAAELAFSSGVTSALQTQLNAKLANNLGIATNLNVYGITNNRPEEYTTLVTTPGAGVASTNYLDCATNQIQYLTNLTVGSIYLHSTNRTGFVNSGRMLIYKLISSTNATFNLNPSWRVNGTNNVFYVSSNKQVTVTLEVDGAGTVGETNVTASYGIQF